MNYSKRLAFLFLIIIGCTPQPTREVPSAKSAFSDEVKALKDYFHIPGMAVLIQKGDSIIHEEYLGVANMESGLQVDSTTQFPIASLTKVFAGTALMQLMEEGKLSLDDPIDTYLKNPTFGDSVQVKHIMSHTSQGIPGQQFYYSYRFGALTPAIAKASGQSFESYVQKEILEPLGLRSTYMFTDSSAVTPTTALPYNVDDGIVPGIMEFGASASAGIVSTAQDMATFSRAMDDNTLISAASKKIMFSPFQPGLPYGHGIFSQTIENKKVVWGYGQYDSYSSLLLKVPEDDLTLVLLANNNLMSDPARLIYGDVASSLFALSFLKNYVLNRQEMPLFEPEDEPLGITSELHRKKLLAEALAASFMARFDNNELEKSKRLLRKTFEIYPNYLDYAHLNLLHNLNFLKSVHLYKELGEFNEFDHQIEAIAQKLLEKDPNNPYANVYMGEYHDGKGNLEKAKVHFETIVNTKNFSPFWYTSTAKQWLEAHK